MPSSEEKRKKGAAPEGKKKRATKKELLREIRQPKERAVCGEENRKESAECCCL